MYVNMNMECIAIWLFLLLGGSFNSGLGLLKWLFL